MLLRRSGAAFVAVVVGLLNWMGEAPAAHAETVHVIVSAKVATVQVAKDDEREAWTFDGTMPGPVIRVKEGDTVEFTLKNEADGFTRLISTPPKHRGTSISRGLPAGPRPRSPGRPSIPASSSITAGPTR